MQLLTRVICRRPSVGSWRIRVEGMEGIKPHLAVLCAWGTFVAVLLFFFR